MATHHRNVNILNKFKKYSQSDLIRTVLWIHCNTKNIRPNAYLSSIFDAPDLKIYDYDTKLLKKSEYRRALLAIVESI